MNYNKTLEELRYKWRGYSVVDDSFEDAGISLNADRIADWWLAEIEKIRGSVVEECLNVVINELTPHEFESDNQMIEGAIVMSKEKHLNNIKTLLAQLKKI